MTQKIAFEITALGLVAALVLPGAAHAAVTLTHVHGLASTDSGERFVKSAGNGEGLAAFFDLDGKYLWYAAFGGRPTLVRMPLKGEHAVQVALPPLTNDAVAHIAQNPARRREYAIATFERSVYVSKDAGQTWSQIAHQGDGE